MVFLDIARSWWKKQRKKCFEYTDYSFTFFFLQIGYVITWTCLLIQKNENIVDIEKNKQIYRF
jgi:hypothetical protein